MTKTEQWKLQLSATALQTFKACPFRYFLKYVKGIKKAEDTVALRWGSNWHTVLEILSLEPGSECNHAVSSTAGDFVACPICQGTGKVPADPMDAALRKMDEVYSNFGTKTPTELEVEKVQILYMASAYRWYYTNDNIKVLHREQKFDIGIPNLTTGRKIRNVNVVGMIDKTGEHGNEEMVIEHKSTSKPIDPDSTYWSRLNLDTQTTLYPFATRFMNTGKHINGVLYDVVHKPTIKPKKLSQGESNKFVEDGKYCGQTFEVVINYNEGDNPTMDSIIVGQEVAEITAGAKAGTFAVRETPKMYGARLLQDIGERPIFYFARKPVMRTETDLERFHKELVCMVDTIKHMKKNEGWFHNEEACEATFRCSFIDICYNNMDPDGVLPDGLIRKERK